MNDILSFRGLTKSYNHALPAIDNINLNLNAGRIIGLLDPNGSGKTTLIKMICGLLTPTSGSIFVDGMPVGPATKAITSYLPDRTYLSDGMTVNEAVEYFADFYTDFDKPKAYRLLTGLSINPGCKMKTLSKGTKEKVQLILVMSRHARLYLLDEPIAGVDPAARDFILHTILTNCDPGATVLISTHLIADVQDILQEALFLQQGRVALYDSTDNIRQREGKSVDELFREVYRCW